MTRIAIALIFLGASGAHGHSHTYRPGDESTGLSKMLRQIYGGSKLREFVHQFAEEPLPNQLVGAAAGPVTTSLNGQMEQTFVSPPMTMLNGEVGNMWLPIDWPQGHIAVQGYAAEVVQAGPNGEAPPAVPCCGGPGTATRDTVFMHHWTVNKWQLPTPLYKDIVSEGGLQYHLTLRDRVGYMEFFGGAGLNGGANGPCWDANLHLYFGIGNEVRTKTKDGLDPYAFPDPYGVCFDGPMMRKRGEFMVLNTHLIDIRNVSNRRACEECKCSEMGAHAFLNVTTGGLSCCHSTTLDGAKCKMAEDAPARTNVTYHVRYTLKYRNFDSNVLPLEVITFDATDNNTKWGDMPYFQGGFPEKHEAHYSDPNSVATVNDGRSGDFDGNRACHIEYYVPKCKAGQSCVHRIQNSWTLPYPINIVFIRNHFHAGGINMTTTGGGKSCTGVGTYDETGNLVDISTCRMGKTGWKDGVWHVARGDQMLVNTNYKQDPTLPHYGVMAMSFVYVHVPTDQSDIHV